MSKELHYGLVIILTTFCLYLLLFTSILKNAWPQDATKIEILINELKDEDPNVRVKSVHALLKLGPDAKEALPALIEALNDEDETVRWYAAVTLERLNTPEAKRAIEEYKKRSN